METYYSILELHPSSTNAEITDSYSRLSKFQHRIDNNDYDNFHEQIRINNVNQAYNILRDRCKRFQYDIRNFGKIEYVDLNFNNESDLQNFISTILDECSDLKLIEHSLKEQIGNLEQKIDQILRESLQEKTNYRIEFELERVMNYYFALFRNISHLSVKQFVNSCLISYHFIILRIFLGDFLGDYLRVRKKICNFAQK